MACGGNEKGNSGIEKAHNIDNIKHKIVVMSGKGGVGKSTVATNLALSLAMHGLKTGLVDCDIHGPTIPKMLGIENEKLVPTASGTKPVIGPHNLKVMSMAFLLSDTDTPVIWRGPVKMGVIRQFLEDISWGDLDYLIVDLPPGTGDEPLTIAQLIPNIDGAVIVTTPQDVALLSVRKSINFAHVLKLPVVGIIENMSSLCCPHCAKNIDLFGSGGGAKAALDMSIPFLGKIPFSLEIVTGGDCGKPYLLEKGSSQSKKVWDEIVVKIEEFVNRDDKSINKEAINMKIGIPSIKPGGLDAMVSAHFGHCELYTVVELDEKKIKKVTTIGNEGEHDCSLPVKILAKEGVKAVLIGGIGRGPLLGFKEVGIDVYVGASGNVKDAISDYQKGLLKVATLDDVCTGCHND